MSTFLRKSFKVGPLRLNLSRSGLGVSAGVKGLRVGVNSQGKNYITGGRYGLYFRDSLSGSTKSSYNKVSNTAFDKHKLKSDDAFQQIAEKVKSKLPDIFGFVLPDNKSRLIILVLTGFLLVCFGVVIGANDGLETLGIIIFLLGFIVTLFGPIDKKLRNYRADKYKTTILNTIKERNVEEVKTLIEQIINKHSKDTGLISYLIADSYFKMIPDIIDDMVIDDNEKQIINIIKSHLSPELIEQINTICLYSLLSLMTKDRHLDHEEEKFALEFMRIFPVSEESNNEFMEIINNYIRVREIGEKPLKTIKPSANIKEANSCYYESPFRQLKDKIVKSYTRDGVKHKITQFVADKEGVIFITKGFLQFLGSGHTSIKLQNVLSMNFLDEEEGIIEITVTNRKTPVYITTPDVVETAAVLDKVLEETSN